MFGKQQTTLDNHFGNEEGIKEVCQSQLSVRQLLPFPPSLPVRSTSQTHPHNKPLAFFSFFFFAGILNFLIQLSQSLPSPVHQAPSYKSFSEPLVNSTAAFCESHRNAETSPIQPQFLPRQEKSPSMSFSPLTQQHQNLMPPRTRVTLPKQSKVGTLLAQTGTTFYLRTLTFVANGDDKWRNKKNTHWHKIQHEEEYGVKISRHTRFYPAWQRYHNACSDK